MQGMHAVGDGIPDLGRGTPRRSQGGPPWSSAAPIELPVPLRVVQVHTNVVCSGAGRIAGVIPSVNTASPETAIFMAMPMTRMRGVHEPRRRGTTPGMNGLEIEDFVQGP